MPHHSIPPRPILLPDEGLNQISQLPGAAGRGISRSLCRDPASGGYPSQIRRIDFEICRTPFLKNFQQWSNLHRTDPGRLSCLFFGILAASMDDALRALTLFGGRNAHFACCIPREPEFDSTEMKLRVLSDGQDAVAHVVVKRKRRNCPRRREFERTEV